MRMTPDTGVEHLYWSLILRELDWDFLFLLLLYHYPLCQKNIGEGAAFYMMRQLGGSFIAIHYYIYHQVSRTQSKFAAHLDGSKFEVNNDCCYCKRIYV
jgi:DHA2 family multidrug resistance protein